MLESLINEYGGLLFPLLVLIVIIVSLIRNIRKRNARQPTASTLGLLGKILGALVFRDLPRNIVGEPPTGRFQKPDFSYDEGEEETVADGRNQKK